MKIAVLGAGGRMGRRVVRQVLEASDLELVAAVGRPGTSADVGELAGVGACGVRLGADFADADVVVDFALPVGTMAALPLLQGRPLVTGVTGLEPEDEARLHAYDGPLLHAANFSTGVNLLLSLIAQAARALPDHDIEIVEAHHTRKRDAPSGTGLALADAAATARGWDLSQVRQDGRVGAVGARPVQEIGLHAIRAGGVVGEHEVWIASQEEVLKLSHSASSRDTFAAGALRAARWIVGRAPGRYTMGQVLGLG